MIDLNDFDNGAAQFNLADIRDRLASSAAHWIPGYFPQGVVSRNRRSIRCGDLTGRAPSGNGSCIIHLTGSRAG
jgi:hypothetical protein